MIGTKIKLLILGGGLLAAAIGGWSARDWKCDSAKAKAELAAERQAHAATRIDLEAEKRTTAHTKEALDVLARNMQSREETIRERTDDKTPVAACRSLDGAAYDWLRRIAPR